MSTTKKITKKRLGAIQGTWLGAAAAAVLVVGATPVALGAPRGYHQSAPGGLQTDALHSRGSIPTRRLLQYTPSTIGGNTTPNGHGDTDPGDLQTDALHNRGSIPTRRLLQYTPSTIGGNTTPNGHGDTDPGDMRTDAMHNRGSITQGRLLTFTPQRLVRIDLPSGQGDNTAGDVHTDAMRANLRFGLGRADNGGARAELGLSLRFR